MPKQKTLKEHKDKFKMNYAIDYMSWETVFGLAYDMALEISEGDHTFAKMEFLERWNKLHRAGEIWEAPPEKVSKL